MLLRLPEISSREGGAVITEWRVGLDKKIKKGQDILEVSSDKATFDIPSPCDGQITAILKKQGEAVLAGEVIAEIREE
jgi:pyruvate/2-oxoglutarate dehydrogenase complex dihydrolipoamide acyltransferase (E2) component